MSMIPDTSPPAQPSALYRVTITNSTSGFDTVLFDATEATARTVAARIVAEQGGDGGTIYQHHGGGKSTYFATVTVPSPDDDPTREAHQKRAEEYQRLLAQPVELYWVDIANSKTDSTRVRFSATTDDEANATALGIVDDHGGDYGDIYKHGRWSCVYTHHAIVGPCPDEPLTREDILAALVAGDRTEQEIRDRFGVRLDRLLKGGDRALYHCLQSLLMDDLLVMVDEFGTPGWLYRPTKKGRELVQARQGGVS